MKKKKKKENVKKKKIRENKKLQRDSMLNLLVIDDKSQNRIQSFESKTGAIFGKECDLKYNVFENLISLTIVFKSHYKLIKSIVDLSFMTIQKKDHASKESINHS